MKRHRQKTSDKSQLVDRKLQAQELAQVRGGGISGSGHTANEDGVIHAQ